MFVKPADPKIKVRKPDRTHLAADGEDVPDTTYWRRRLRDGDVVKSRPAKAAKGKE